MNNLSFGEYCNELVLLYKNRAMLTGDESRRWVIDNMNDVLEAWQEGYSHQAYFEDDYNSWGTGDNV